MTTTSCRVPITSPKRPIGNFERPRSARAEARRSDRSLRNVVLAAEAAHGPATALADWDLPETESAVADLHDAASHTSDPAFQDVTDPKTRLRIEVLKQAVQSLNEAIQVEIGARLGIAPGCNSQDGDRNQDDTPQFSRIASRHGRGPRARLGRRGRLSYLAASRGPDKSFALYGLDHNGTATFRFPFPRAATRAQAIPTAPRPSPRHLRPCH